MGSGSGNSSNYDKSVTIRKNGREFAMHSWVGLDVSHLLSMGCVGRSVIEVDGDVVSCVEVRGLWLWTTALRLHRACGGQRKMYSELLSGSGYATVKA